MLFTVFRKYQPLYPFGHGLSYVTFAYTNMTVTITPKSESGPRQPTDLLIAEATVSEPEVTVTQFWAWDVVTVNVTVTNLGTRRAAMPVLLFITVEFRIIPPELKLLQGAFRIYLDASQSTTVSFQVLFECSKTGILFSKLNVLICGIL